MVIHFTKKLAKKLHTPELDQGDVPAGDHLRWYANLFTARRVQYILTTNAASLLSVVMYGRGITDDSDYIMRLVSDLRDLFDDLNMQLVFKRVILPTTGQIILAKATNRSVLGSMNDMVHHCKFRLDMEDVSPWKLSQEINSTPYSALKYRYPKKAFASMPLDNGNEG